jgi:hypothetical protein
VGPCKAPESTGGDRAPGRWAEPAVVQEYHMVTDHVKGPILLLVHEESKGCVNGLRDNYLEKLRGKKHKSVILMRGHILASCVIY